MKSISEIMSAQSGELRQQVNVPTALRERPSPRADIPEAFRIANGLRALAELVARMPDAERAAVERACAVVGVTVPAVTP